MHKPDKAEFAQACLKSKVKCVDPFALRIGSKVIDDGELGEGSALEDHNFWLCYICAVNMQECEPYNCCL